MKVLAFLVVLAILTPSNLANNLLGSLQLDSLTFDKTVRAHPFTIVKFDGGYPTGKDVHQNISQAFTHSRAETSGEKHETWGKLASDLGEIYDIMVAEVRVKDYGDRMNEVK